MLCLQFTEQGALGINFDVVEILWTFSIYLEPLAIIPQLIVLQRYKEVENLTGNYIFFMGSYRALYILNWVYRSYYEPYYRHHWIVYACGIAQTAPLNGDAPSDTSTVPVQLLSSSNTNRPGSTTTRAPRAARVCGE